MKHTDTAARAFDFRGAREAVAASALEPTQRLVLLQLIEHMPNCQPSVARLAERTGRHRTTVLRTLAALEAAGWLSIERRDGRRSRYRINMAPNQSHNAAGSMALPVAQRDITGREVQPLPVARCDLKQEDKQEGKPRALCARKPSLHNTGPVFPGAQSRTLDVPPGEPPAEYFQQASMAGVSRARASETWAFWQSRGLPQGGVRNLNGWLIHQAKKHRAANDAATGAAVPPRRGASPRQGDHGRTGFEKAEIYEG